jgi:hypothetical protein
MIKVTKGLKLLKVLVIYGVMAEVGTESCIVIGLQSYLHGRVRINITLFCRAVSRC